jgi:acetyl esterase/lipase
VAAARGGAEVIEDEGPGPARFAELLDQPRVQVAHRLGADLLVEAELRRDGRADPVPFVLGYAAADGGWVLRHAHAGASSVTVGADGGYLFLSDRRSAEQRDRGHAGRSLWRHRPGADHAPLVVLTSPRDVVSYAAAASTVVAAVWLPEGPSEDGRTATVVSGDLWPRSAYHCDGDVLRLLRLAPGSETPEPLPLRLDEDTLFTGEVALTPDGVHCAAGVVRFLRGGHRRYGLLLFAVAEPNRARALWADDDLTEPVAAPDGAWFACTAERVARPGLAPRQEVVLVAADGSRVLRAAPVHPDWLRPRAWADADTVLCVGEQGGRRHLWRVRGGRAERVDVGGSVQAVTTAAGEALVVRSDVDLPPEVVSLPLGFPAGPEPVFAPAAAVAPAGRVRRLVHRAPDGSTWHSRLCLPETDPANPLPVLVWCHGGPMLSWTDWSWRWNPWPFVAAGYAVLMPDPPLSVGYGQDAVERGWGRWTSDVAAVAAGQVREALEDPRLDEDRVAVMGASFGGFLALALATLLPEVRLVVSHCGWADFAAVARASDLHWHWLREYGPVDGSPSYHRESLRLDAIDPGVRVLLSHGCEDAHVPVGEARAVFRTLDTLGVDVSLMLLPGEKHGIRKPANTTAWFRWVLRACHEVLLARPARKEASRR